MFLYYFEIPEYFYNYSPSHSHTLRLLAHPHILLTIQLNAILLMSGEDASPWRTAAMHRMHFGSYLRALHIMDALNKYLKSVEPYLIHL